MSCKRKKFDRHEREINNEIQAEIKANEEIPTAETVIKPVEEIKPVIEESAPAQPQPEQSVEADQKPQQPKQEKKTKKVRGKRNKKQEAEPVVVQPEPQPAAETTPVVSEASVETTAEEAPKKTRRPNRGSSSRKGRSKKTNEENIETNE